MAYPGRSLKKSVYVDGNLVTGPDKTEILKEIEAIFAQVPGRPIDTK